MNRLSQGAVRKLKDGDGNYLWQPSFQLGQAATLAGHEVVEVPDMADIGAGAVAALFGDMAKTYLVVDRLGIRVLRDPYTNKPYVGFYTTKRVGGGVQKPGRHARPEDRRLSDHRTVGAGSRRPRLFQPDVTAVLLDKPGRSDTRKTAESHDQEDRNQGGPGRRARRHVQDLRARQGRRRQCRRTGSPTRTGST